MKPSSLLSLTLLLLIAELWGAPPFRSVRFSTSFEASACWELKEPSLFCDPILLYEGNKPQLVSQLDSAFPRCQNAVQFDLYFDSLAHNKIRSELKMVTQQELAKKVPREKRADYTFSIFFPENYVRDTLPEIVAQWRFFDWMITPELKTMGSPQLSLQVIRDSLYIELLANDLLPDPSSPEKPPGHIWIPIQVRKRLPLGPLPKERWIDFRFQLLWSTKKDGVMRAWIDGELKQEYRGPTTYKSPYKQAPYFKIGIYKWAWGQKRLTPQTVVTTHRRLWIDRLQIRSGWGGSSWGMGCPEENSRQ